MGSQLSRSEAADRASLWLMLGGARAAATCRLICFSPAGSGAAAFRGWSDLAPHWLEIVPVQLPGRENRLRESPISDVATLASSIGAAIRSLDGRPFAFYGHSLGAMVAFETARWLRREGAPVPLGLFVGASRPPQLPWPDPPVRGLSDLDLLQEVNRRYGSVPEVVMADEELRALLTPALRADMSIIEAYRYETEPPFDCPIVAFGGTADRKVRMADLTRWAEQSTGAFVEHSFDEGHLFHLPRRRELVATIAAQLASVGADAPRRGS